MDKYILGAQRVALLRDNEKGVWVEPEIEKLPIGTRFQIEQRLGAGTFGVVYRAFDRERQMRVALKSLRRVSPKTIYNFKQEFRSLAGLVHPNLAALYELFSIDDHWFFTMELVEGVDFLAYVRQAISLQNNVSDAAETLAATDHPTLPEGHRKSRPVQLPPLSEGRLSGALAQLAEGVHALHQAGKLHRDLKPSNVLVTPNGRVAILDFGLVTDQEAASRSDGAVVGTAAYMAPEQAAGTSIGPAADWYSVGVMLYQAITGRLPFEGGVKEVLHLKQREDAPHPLVVEPSAPVGLSEIAVSLLLRDPNKRTSGADLLQRLGVEPSQAGGGKALFVGREDLLDELRAASAEAKEKARGVRVFGASGMGKSVLLRAFLEEQRTQGALLLAGRCYEHENVPYKALDSAVDALCRYLLTLSVEGSVALIPPGAKALAKLFPVLRRLPAFSHANEPEIPDPTEQRRAAALCLRGIFERLSAQNRVVLWIDDLQWGDLDSVALLEELFRPPAPPILFLMSYRSELAAGSELLRELSRPGMLRGLQSSDLEVKPLALHEALDLALLLLGEGDLASQARPDAIARESRGNPYFVSELVRYARRGHRGEAPTLDSALAARIQDLPEEERRILELAAIAGRPVPRWLLCRAARTPLEENRALSALLVKNLLAASGFGRDDQVECYHDRVREAAASQLSRGQRQELHAALAAALLSEGNPDPEAMVEHLVGAGQASQAAEYASEAAEQAASALAFERAARLYQQAIELGAKDKPGLMLKRAASLSNAGRSLAAAEVYLDAAQQSPLKEATSLRERAAQELLRGGDITRGRALLSALLEAADLPMAPSASRAMMSVVWRRLRIELRGLKFQERPAEESEANELRRFDLCWMAAIGLGNLDTIHGADFQARGLLLALKSGEPNRVARALSAEAAFLASEGGKHQKKITEVLARAAEIVTRHDAPYNRAFLTMIRGEVAFLLGDFRSAKEHLLDAQEQLTTRCQGVSWEIATARFYLLFALYYLGELHTLGKLQVQYSRDAERRGDLYAATMLRSGHAASGHLAVDSPQGAYQQIEASTAAWTPEGFHVPHYTALLMNAETDLYQGEPQRAHSRIQEAWPKLKNSLLLTVQVIRLEAHLLKARCGLAIYAATQDKQHLAQAIRDLKTVTSEKMPWSDALATLTQAGIYAVQGQHGPAQDALEKALAAFEAHGMNLYAAAARFLLAERRQDHAARAQSEAELHKLVHAPERFLRLLAPGLSQ